MNSHPFAHWTALNTPWCQLAESPRFCDTHWAWIDITGKVLYEWPHLSVLTTQPNLIQRSLPDEIGCILPTQTPHHYVGFGRQGVWLLTPSEHTLVQQAPFPSNEQRFNDGRADARGRAWVSTLVDARHPALASLYCIQNPQSLQIMVNGLIVGNGLAFSPNNDFLYLTDTRQKTVWRYPFDLSSGQLGARELLHHYQHGTERPDGAAMTQDGSYWVAVYEGYRLDRFNLSGKLVESIELPFSRPTMPCFGGHNHSELLVCSAKPDQQFPNRFGFEQISLIACQTSHQGESDFKIKYEL